jgi:hypothetical protein
VSLFGAFSEEKQMLFKVHSYGRILAEATLS